MAKRKARARTAKKKAEGSVRVSVSFPRDDYTELEEIAASQRASIAWVVRAAVAKYLSARTALSNRRGRGGTS